jgi:hypothetical protein
VIVVGRMTRAVAVYIVSSMLNAQCTMHNAQCTMLNVGHCAFGIAHSALGIGHWALCLDYTMKREDCPTTDG